MTGGSIRSMSSAAHADEEERLAPLRDVGEILGDGSQGCGGGLIQHRRGCVERGERQAGRHAGVHLRHPVDRTVELIDGCQQARAVGRQALAGSLVERVDDGGEVVGPEALDRPPGQRARSTTSSAGIGVASSSRGHDAPVGRLVVPRMSGATSRTHAADGSSTSGTSTAVRSEPAAPSSRS
jgi:hypothetical protein